MALALAVPGRGVAPVASERVSFSGGVMVLVLVLGVTVLMGLRVVLVVEVMVGVTHDALQLRVL